MADEVKVEANVGSVVVVAEVKDGNAKSFAKKKVNRFNKMECESELARLAKVGDSTSKYFELVTKQLKSL